MVFWVLFWEQVIPADLEAFDPEYFSNLKWFLGRGLPGSATVCRSG